MKHAKNAEKALQERIKELNCLYGMARLAERHHDSMEDFLKCLVVFLPPSWQYGDIACAHIVFRGRTFASRKFRRTKWRQSAPIRVCGKPVGEVTIVYKEERPSADEGPFLKEERALLEGVAQRRKTINSFYWKGKRCRKRMRPCGRFLPGSRTKKNGFMKICR